ncbi:MAG: hypothetical protein QG622_2916, partial [Actinomycetota bacterium]|nr:hypothetical protein [Actinomycetota bacterium]
LGARWSDAELLSLAIAFESATRARCTYQTVPSDVDLQNSGRRGGIFSL